MNGAPFPVQVPAAYQGREHTWLKHRVLDLYLTGWAHKLGSVVRQRAVRLWYVDCFAGPWRTADEAMADTSISIGLEALRSAARTWSDAKSSLRLGAIFVEKDDKAFADLSRFVGTQGNLVEVHPLHGAFGDHVTSIERLIGDDAAFLFVDPTGWKGAGMRFIAPLAKRPRRDVLVNVMFDDINRFKDDSRAFLRAQMRDFFGLDDSDIAPGLSEEKLIGFYREQMKRVCGVRFALDLAIPHPVKKRTRYRLVVGGHHEEVVRLFRHVEAQVVGREAPGVRAEARERERVRRTKQPSLPLLARMSEEKSSLPSPTAAKELEHQLTTLLDRERTTTYGALWPLLLEACHVTEPELRRLLWSMAETEKIAIPNRSREDQRLKHHHRIALPP